MRCKYCNHWQECNPDLITMVKVGSKTISERFCRAAGKRKRGDDDACANIKVAKFFFCDAYGDRPAIIVCLYKQGKLKRKPSASKDNTKCFSCSQGEDDVFELTRGRNLLLEHGFIKRNLPPLRKTI